MIYLSTGIDVSKDKLDICITFDEIHFQAIVVSNDAKGFEQLWDWLRLRAEPTGWRIALEATSAYHRAVVAWFAERDVLLLVLNPRQARDLGKGMGILRKNDRTDARVLASCAFKCWRNPVPLATGVKYALQEVSRRIDVLTRQKASERKRLLKPGACEGLVESCRRLIQFIEEEILLLEAKWAALLEECQDLTLIYKSARTVPGVGKVTARIVISELFVVERTRTTRQCVAYGGLAPQEYSSGSSLRRKGATYSTGNKRLRSALYMSSISVIHRDAEARDLFMRITAQGKPKKVAVVALMAKTLRRIVAVAKRGTPWVTA
jgi:transposase